MVDHNDKIEAAKLKADIELWMPSGVDDTTFQQCSMCGKCVCPECCGICPIDVCGALCCKVSVFFERVPTGHGENADWSDRSASLIRGARVLVHQRIKKRTTIGLATSSEVERDRRRLFEGEKCDFTTSRGILNTGSQLAT